jgi:hypothetical protein
MICAAGIDVKEFASMKKTIEAACSEAGNVAMLVLSHGVSVTGTFGVHEH